MYSAYTPLVYLQPTWLEGAEAPPSSKVGLLSAKRNIAKPTYDVNRAKTIV